MNYKKITYNFHKLIEYKLNILKNKYYKIFK